MATAGRTTGLEIAIVGMAARMPGADNVDAYWELLRDGKEGITQLSDAELRAAGLDEERLRDAALIRALGLLQDVERFDAEFFGYSARDAEILDPQQRLFLEQAWTALENAGYTPEKFDGSVGVFAGSGLGAYTLKLVASGWFLRQQVGFQKAVSNDKDHLSTATAYKLGLTGPAVTVQTTCSTSLVAVHLACRSLLSGECDMALAGGVTAGLGPGSVLSFQEGNILSMDGRCRPFDAQASGTVVSNGVGVVVLRRLDDAIRDKDNIRAVICASAINNDGSSKIGYLSPSVSGQYQVIRKALRLAGVHPDTIDYVEAHGTATLKGDPIEVRALTRAYREQTGKTQYCALSSVKSNIGHTDTAAGAAGLIKAVMAMEHATIPATLHFHAPNPELALEASPFYVSNTSIPWPRAERPRRAAVSSFGLGGTNAHLILEQAPEKPHAARPENDEQLVLLSARTRSALTKLAGQLAQRLLQDESISLQDVAFTLRHGRADLKERAFFVGARAQIIDQLRAFEAESGPSQGPTAHHQPAWVVEGSFVEWWALVSAYYNVSPAFRDLVAGHAPLFTAAGISIADQLSTGRRDVPDSPVTRLVAGYLLGRLLLRLGIDLQAIISTGDHELVAACVAGALKIEDGLRIACFLRDRSAAEAEPNGLVRLLTPASPRISYFSSRMGTWHEPGSVLSDEYWRDFCRSRIPGGSADLDPNHMAEFCLLRIGQGETRGAGQPQPTGQFDLLGEASIPADYHRRALWIVGELWRRGHVLRREVVATTGRRIVLPTYPFEGKRYWIDGDEGAAAAHAEPASKLADSASAAERFYVPTWRRCADRLELPADAGRNSGPAASEGVSHLGQYVIFAAPGDPLAAVLADEVRGAAPQITLVHDTRSGAANGSAFLLDGTYGGDYTRLVRHAGLSRAHANRFVIFDSFLDALEPVFGKYGPGAWFCVPMFLAQAIGEVSLEGGIASENWPAIEIILVSKAMWSLDGEEPIYPEKALARALGTVIAQEYPNLAFRTVDLPATGSEAYATGYKRQLLSEELCKNGETAGTRHVALRGRNRWEQVFTPVRPRALGQGKFRRNGVYLITGGLGGIGLSLAEYLAREFQARLVLVGRSAPPAETESLARIRELGGEVRVFSADVTDWTAMLEVKREAERAFGSINGVVHAAGCMPESIVQRMTGASAWRGLQAKVGGTRVLMKLFDGAPLDFLCLFSSLRAITGGVGNGDYAAANAYMDAFAEKAWIDGKTHVLSVNWDGWAGVGMTTRIKPGVAKQPPEPPLMPVEQALAAFAGVLSLSCPRIAVSLVPVDDLLAAPTAPAAEQSAWIEPPAADAGSAAGQRPEHLDTPYVAPRNEIETSMAAIWESLLGISPIGVFDSFSALGGDSVTSLQISAKAAEINIRVEPFQALEDDTIAALCQQLDAGPSTAQSSAAESMEPAAVAGVVPLTPIQHWFFDLKLANPGHFNQAFMLRSLRKLDAGCLERAFDAVLRHHDALRSRFSRTAEGWTQYQLEQAAGAAFRVEDLRSLASESWAARITDSCAAAQAALDLEKAELVKMIFFDCGDPVHDRLMICAHHLVVDALSWRVLMDDLQTSYSQAERGEPIRLPAKSTAFKSWAEGLKAYAETPRAPADRDYWTHVLAADRRELPRDFAQGKNTVGSIATASREIVFERNAAPTQGGARAQSVFLAALGSAIEEWAGSGRVLIDLEGHGRACAGVDADLSRTVGWFTALHPFAIPARREHADEETVAAVQAALEAVPNYGVDYGVLAYLCNDPVRHAPRAEVLALYMRQAGQGASANQLLDMASESPGWTQDPDNERSHVLEIVAGARDSGLSLSVAYSKALHDASTIELFLDRFVFFYKVYAPLAFCGQETERHVLNKKASLTRTPTSIGY